MLRHWNLRRLNATISFRENHVNKWIVEYSPLYINCLRTMQLLALLLPTWTTENSLRLTPYIHYSGGLDPSGFSTPWIYSNLSVALCSYLLTRQHSNCIFCRIKSIYSSRFSRFLVYWRYRQTDRQKTGKLNVYRYPTFDNNYWVLTDMDLKYCKKG